MRYEFLKRNIHKMKRNYFFKYSIPSLRIIIEISKMRTNWTSFIKNYHYISLNSYELWRFRWIFEYTSKNKNINDVKYSEYL